MDDDVDATTPPAGAGDPAPEANPAPGWSDRTVRGPAAEFLTREEARAMLPFSREFFDARLKDGTFPPPAALSAKSQIFNWEHVVFMALWLKYGSASRGVTPG